MERVRPSRLKTSPFVLPTESAEKFEAEARRFESAVKPRNKIEEMYAKDISSCDWQIERLRRCASGLLSMALPEALFDVLTRRLNALDRDNAQILVERWRSGDPSARTEVASILEKHGLDDSAIEAEAHLQCLPRLTAIEQLQASLASRRDKALAGIAFCRDMEAQQEAKAALEESAIARVERVPRLPRPVKHGL
jgi:hypothetical protein